MSENVNPDDAAMVMAGFGDRIKGIRDIIDFIRKFDLSEIGDLITAVKAMMAAEGLPAQIKAAINVLDVGAGITETDVDDRIVDIIQKVATDDMIEVIVKIIDMIKPHAAEGVSAMQASVTPMAVEQAAVEAKGIPWNLLVQIAIAIYELLKDMDILPG